MNFQNVSFRARVWGSPSYIGVWGSPSYIGVWGTPSYLPFCLGSVPDRALAKRQPHRANRTGPVVIIANHHRHHQPLSSSGSPSSSVTKTNVHIASSCTNEHQRSLLMLHCFQHRVIAPTAVFGGNLICNWRCRTAVENLKFKSCGRKFLITNAIVFLWGRCEATVMDILPFPAFRAWKKVQKSGTLSQSWSILAERNMMLGWLYLVFF